MSLDGAVVELAGPSRPLGIVDLATRLGGLRYLELVSYERLGRLAAEGDMSVSLALFMAKAALAHAGRGDLLGSLLPVSPGLPDAAELTVCPGEAVRALLARSLEQPGVLASLYETAEAAYAIRLAHRHPSGEANEARVLERCLESCRATRADLSSTLGQTSFAP